MDGFIIERIGDENVIRLSDDELARHGLEVGDRVDLRQSRSGHVGESDRAASRYVNRTEALEQLDDR